MMAAMMGDMMGDLMGGGGKKNKKGKVQGGFDPFGMGGMGGMGMEAMMMEMMMGDDDGDDIFAGDEYDSDEVEMIGKQMGLSSKELTQLKKDLKLKYSQNK